MSQFGICADLEERRESVGVTTRIDIVCNNLISRIIRRWLFTHDRALAFTLRLDGRTDRTFLTFTQGAAQVLETHFLGVAAVAHFAGLGLRGRLADAVFADEVGSAGIGGVAEMAWAAEGAVALLGDVGVERDGGEFSEIGVWGWGKMLGPVEVAAGGVGALENVFERGPGDI